MCTEYIFCSLNSRAFDESLLYFKYSINIKKESQCIEHRFLFLLFLHFLVFLSSAEQAYSTFSCSIQCMHEAYRRGNLTFIVLS